MGLLDMLQGAAANMGGDHAKVAGGMMDTMQQQPGGVAGMAQSFQQNGLGGLVQQWTSGQTAPASPDQIQQGMGGTGIIEQISQRTGLSPAVIKGSMAVIVPMMIHHLAQNGNVTADGQPTGQPVQDHAGMLQSILGRFI